ncbi:serine hydrolase domain-containing protein [Aminobacter sp. UC22_36]|uniref:serine hydrolase domain-containing protein n=1 Tax=Aminobacter sp. UC22_36 TaxID=3374549 RepID=UPI0037571D49
MNFTEKLDRYLQAEVDNSQVPGLGVAIVHDGEIVHLRGYGLANVENLTPVTPDTVFHSGSTGKMFTSACVMFLLQDGRIKLDDPLSRYISEGPESWAGITIRNLLSMMAGFGNFDIVFAPTDSGEGAIPLNLWQDHSDDQLIDLARRSPFMYQPGEGYQYSNTGYILAGLVVARISGKPYYELLRERLFEPVGMATAREASWYDIVPNRAAGHCIREGRLENRYWAAPTLQRTGDGGLYYSPRDIAHWLLELDNPTVLRPETIALMSEPVLMQNGQPSFNSYALGWQNSELRGHRKIRHGGTWDGFRAEIARFPARKLSVCVLANMDEAQVARIGQKIAGIVDPALAPYEPIAEVDADLTQRDNELLQAIVDRRAPRGSFTDEAWRQWNNGWFEQVASSGVTIAGAPLELTHHEGDGGAYLRRYRLEMGGYFLHWTIRRDAGGRVSEMRFHME